MEWNRILRKNEEEVEEVTCMHGLDTFAECWAKELIAFGVLYSYACSCTLCGCVFFTQQWKTFLQNDKMAWRRCSKICIYVHERATNITQHRSGRAGGKRERKRERARERMRDVWQKTSTEITRAIKYLIQLLALAHRTSQITRWNFNAAFAAANAFRASERTSIWYYGISNIFTFIMRLFPIHIHIFLSCHSFLSRHATHRRHRWSPRTFIPFHSKKFHSRHFLCEFSQFSVATLSRYGISLASKMVSRIIKSVANTQRENGMEWRETEAPDGTETGSRFGARLKRHHFSN